MSPRSLEERIADTRRRLETEVGFAFFRIRPRSIQAWREEDELAGRWILRDGTWLS